MILATIAVLPKGTTSLARWEGDSQLQQGFWVVCGRSGFRDLGHFLLLLHRDSVARDQLTADTGERYEPDEVSLLAPVLRPPKVVCVGLNYRDHAAEQNKALPESPMFFAKAANSVCGPEAPIPLNPEQEGVDAEVELGVVIGRAGSPGSLDEAEEAIFGYTVVNDISDRQRQRRDGQNYRGKSYRNFCPTGPVVVTKEHWQPASQRILCRWDDRVMQDSHLGNLHRSPRDLILELGRVHELEAGDLLATGTPAGVGEHRRPPCFLKPSMRLESHIEGLGTLRNPIIQRPWSGSGPL